MTQELSIVKSNCALLNLCFSTHSFYITGLLTGEMFQPLGCRCNSAKNPQINDFFTQLINYSQLLPQSPILVLALALVLAKRVGVNFLPFPANPFPLAAFNTLQQTLLSTSRCIFKDNCEKYRAGRSFALKRSKEVAAAVVFQSSAINL